MVPAERLAARGGRDQIEQRVPHERDGDVRLAIQRRLERKDDEGPGHEPLHGPEPPAPPRPRLRADVVDDGDAEGRDRRAEPEVDLRKVDGHEDVGAFRPRRLHQPAIRSPGMRQHRHRLGQSGGGQPGAVRGQPASRRRELRAPQPEDLRTGTQPADLGGQGARVQIAGRLAAREHHLGRRHVAGLDAPGSGRRSGRGRPGPPAGDGCFAAPLSTRPVNAGGQGSTDPARRPTGPRCRRIRPSEGRSRTRGPRPRARSRGGRVAGTCAPRAGCPPP